MKNLVKGFAVTAMATALAMGMTTPAEAVSVFRCQMALVDVPQGGTDANCRYTAGSLGGLAEITVYSGSVDLYVDCNLGGLYVENVGVGVKTFNYSNGGVCFAAIFPRGEGLTWAVADVGSVFPV